MSWVIVVAVFGVTVLVVGALRSYMKRRHVEVIDPLLRAHAFAEKAQIRAEALLRASVTPAEYAFLIQNGYLEVPSRLYANRVYQIPHKRRRVRVYALDKEDASKRYKLGELCLVACEPVPDADVVLTHKWLLEADERTYLSTANWISGNNWNNGYPV